MCFSEDGNGDKIWYYLEIEKQEIRPSKPERPKAILNKGNPLTITVFFYLFLLLLLLFLHHHLLSHSHLFSNLSYSPSLPPFPSPPSLLPLSSLSLLILLPPRCRGAAPAAPCPSTDTLSEDVFVQQHNVCRHTKRDFLQHTYHICTLLLVGATVAAALTKIT